MAEFKEDSQSVQAHLGILQSVIQRMAGNSSSSKAWCITLVSAVLVIVVDKGKPLYALIAIIPAVLFLVLDTYYLALERMFRKSYNTFIKKLHEGKVVAKDLYAVSPEGSVLIAFLKALGSFSVWPFYLTLIIMIFVAKMMLISPT